MYIIYIYTSCRFTCIDDILHHHHGGYITIFKMKYAMYAAGTFINKYTVVSLLVATINRGNPV